jgi:hypothetical protein
MVLKNSDRKKYQLLDVTLFRLFYRIFKVYVSTNIGMISNANIDMNIHSIFCELKHLEYIKFEKSLTVYN